MEERGESDEVEHVAGREGVDLGDGAAFEVFTEHGGGGLRDDTAAGVEPDRAEHARFDPHGQHHLVTAGGMPMPHPRRLIRDRPPVRAGHEVVEQTVFAHDVVRDDDMPNTQLRSLRAYSSPLLCSASQTFKAASGPSAFVIRQSNVTLIAF